MQDLWVANRGTVQCISCCFQFSFIAQHERMRHATRLQQAVIRSAQITSPRSHAVRRYSTADILTTKTGVQEPHLLILQRICLGHECRASA